MSLLDVREKVQPGRSSRRDRKRLRRELRAHDARSARLAELHHIDLLLAEAARVVERGWMQHGWFAYDDPSGKHRIVTGITPRTARRVSPEQVTGACLIGAMINAAGGPRETSSQLVQRSIDLTWHAAFREKDEPVRWGPSPAERAGHVLDLVRWNDRPERAARDVSALLDRARGLTLVEAERTRAGQHAVTGP